MFVDNEAAKFACVNMASDSPSMLKLLGLLAAFEIQFQTWTWYSRVPSYSNVADAASRLDFKQVERTCGATRVPVRMPRDITKLADLDVCMG